MSSVRVKYKKLDPRAVDPAYHSLGAAAFDLAVLEDVSIPPRGQILARTGLVIKVPDGHVLVLSARSSSPGKKGVTLANGIGIIDADYCGSNDEIKLALLSLRDEIIEIKAGERVAQGTIIPIAQGSFEQVDEMVARDRGGFGSTGD